MIREIRFSFNEIFDQVDWMDGKTKLKAKEKVTLQISTRTK